MTKEGLSYINRKTPILFNGVTLLETLVVIAIISLLSLVGINSINNFKNVASLDNVANEFVSDIRSARNKSMNGILFEGEDVENFVVDGLPEYGIDINNTNYKIIRRCIKTDGGDCSGESPIENIDLSDDYSILTEDTLFFKRISGDSEEKEITIMNKHGKDGRIVKIWNGFQITISNI